MASLLKVSLKLLG